MRHRAAFYLFVLFTFTVAILSGCGGSGSNSGSVATGGTNNGGNGNGGGSSQPQIQWSANVVQDNLGGPAPSQNGKVTIDSNGQVSITLSGVAANTTYHNEFCRFPISNYEVQGQQACFEVNTFTSDASGNVQTQFKFPKSGAWSGQFFFAPNPNDFHNGGFTTDDDIHTATASAQIVPAAAVSAASSASSSAAIGTETVSNATITVALKGAQPNTSFSVGYCYDYGSSGCDSFETLVVTDASGNGSQTFSATRHDVGWNISLTPVGNSNGQFLSGFRIP